MRAGPHSPWCLGDITLGLVRRKQVEGGRDSRWLTVARQQIAVARSPQAGEILAALGTRPVVLVGMPASGKSTIGPQLAKELGVQFVDIDKLIVKGHGNIKDIFERSGELYFRELEARELAEQLKKGPIVIATGGGGFVKQHNRDLIREKAVSIWLNTDLQEIGRRLDVQERLTGDTGRPLLQGPDKKQQLENMFEKRGPDYQQADIRVVPPFKKDKKNASTCVKELYAFLCSREREAALTPAAEISDVPVLPAPASACPQQRSACTMIITTATIAGAASWKPSRRRRHH
ncbi:hypothetical protein AJ88_46910 [Mesorhizobium amorphae CCBAU 01583]|nr:hypothetical protein AJ88_46910 [Mesorhizobium amorphae CCBAU 01583]